MKRRDFIGNVLIFIGLALIGDAVGGLLGAMFSIPIAILVILFIDDIIWKRSYKKGDKNGMAG